MRRGLGLVIVAGLLLLAACGEEKKKEVRPWPEAGPGADVLPSLDQGISDLGPLPDGLPRSDEGPKIEIVAPKAGQTVLGDVLTVQAKITDPDIVDESKTYVVVVGIDDPIKMSITSDADVYEAKVDIRQFKGNIRLWVTATDLKGKVNTSAVVDFARDPGPRIIFLSPVDATRHKASVTVQVIVVDNVEIKDFSVRIGTQKLTQLVNRSTDPKSQIWAGTVEFDDPMFTPSLAGEQVLTAQAENTRGAKTSALCTFIVDNQGPSISITSQTPGELVGGLITISASVSDPAGVIASSVRCVIGNDLDTRTVMLSPSAKGGSFEAQFDTRALSQYYIWPVISCRASDQLGNESHRDIEVALDNGQPILELDPPIDYHIVRKKEDSYQCSQPFDPVGLDAASEGEVVPQIKFIRARIEDQGNYAPSAPWIPIAGVNQGSAVLYLLDDTDKPLVVDTDGDGYCDDINLDVVPTGAAPAPGQAVAVNLAPIPPTGSADFTPVSGSEPTLPGACSTWGDNPSSPGPLCKVVPATIATSYSVDNLPSIYTIPPVGGGFECMGLPFDFSANSFEDGWICAAVVARDNLGNRGVSMPIGIYVWQPLDKLPPSVSDRGSSPSCLGTRDRDGHVTAKACAFRNPRDQEKYGTANAGCTLNQCQDCTSYHAPVPADPKELAFPQAFYHCESYLP